MIATQETNSDPMTFNGGVFKQVFEVISREDITAPTFDFDTGECEYVERVFAEVGGEEFKNDKRHFLVSLSIATDTATFKLFKNDIEIATITDDTYGIFTAVGGFPTQPLKTSFFADFEKIFNLEGPGCYQIKADRVIITNGSTLSSVPYQLFAYSARRANGTIRLKSFQNNDIENGIDYTGMNFEQQVRIFADLIKEPREDIIENYRSGFQDVEQIQDAVIKKYRFKTMSIPSVISNQIMDDMLLGNSVFFTDYNVFGNETLIDIPVFKSSTESEDYVLGQTLGQHEVILQNRTWIRKRS